MQLDNAHVFITGASRGIGAAMARRFAAKGARVSVAARSADALGSVAADIGGWSFPVDLTDDTAVDGLIERVEAEAGPIDVLVNNAGLETNAWLRDVDPDTIRTVSRLNLEVPMLLTRQALPGMMTRGRGHLVYTSSIAGAASFPGLAAYCGTKAGLTNFAATVRAELRDHPVGVTVVSPGPVDTQMWDNLEDASDFEPMLERLRRLQLIPKVSPEKLAKRTVAAVEAERRHVRTPRRLTATFMMNEAPRRIIEGVLSGVPLGGPTGPETVDTDR